MVQFYIEPFSVGLYMPIPKRHTNAPWKTINVKQGRKYLLAAFSSSSFFRLVGLHILVCFTNLCKNIFHSKWTNFCTWQMATLDIEIQNEKKKKLIMFACFYIISDTSTPHCIFVRLNSFSYFVRINICIKTHSGKMYMRITSKW